MDHAQPFRTRWPNGITLYYNLTFSRSSSEGWRSSSIQLRPDIVLVVEGSIGRSLHVFDAKLRIHGQIPATAEASDDDDDDDDDEADKSPLSFKMADIAKMHTYRDALPDVRSAHVLYPGGEHGHYPAQDRHATAGDLVGAIPLVPGEKSGVRAAVIAAMLHQPRHREST